MSENKFKVGDEVILTSQYPFNLTDYSIDVGNFGIIETINGDNCYVRFDTFSVDFIVKESQLDLYSDSSKVESKGIKHDQGKPDLSLIPTDALWGTAAALTYGANKYQRHNFRNGLSYSRLVAATMRHLTAWNEGENDDIESHLSHIDHALASLAMLKYMITNKPEMDDRYIVEKNVDKK